MTSNVSYRRKAHHQHDNNNIKNNDIEFQMSSTTTTQQNVGSENSCQITSNEMNHHNNSDDMIDHDVKKIVASSSHNHINNENNNDHHDHQYSFIRIYYQRIQLLQYRYTISISCLFISIGILITLFIIHHRHQTVIIFHDPWHHGKALLQKTFRGNHQHYSHAQYGGKFHHHYYIGSPKFVTIVLPSVVNPKGRLQRLESIHATWGSYSRAVFVVHNVQEEFPHGSHLTIDLHNNQHNNNNNNNNRRKVIVPSDPYSYPQNLVVPNNLTVDDGLPRLLYTIRTVYEHINPDFAFFVNDHTYVIPEHLCHYIENLNPDYMDIYHGHALRQDEKGNLLNSGAAGYILSRKTMKKLIAKWDVKDPICYVDPNDSTTSINRRRMKWLQGNPGLLIMECLASMNITAIDTRAGNNHRYHRFHAFPLTRLIHGNDGVDDWYVRKHNISFNQFHHNIYNHNYHYNEDIIQSNDRIMITNDTTTTESIISSSSYATLLSGSDCCSEDTLSFHYVEWKECRALFAIRNALLGKGGHHNNNNNYHRHYIDWTDEEIKELIKQHWPTDRQEIGVYSRGLPSNEEDQDSNNTWDDLIHTIRKISNPKYEKEC